MYYFIHFYRGLQKESYSIEPRLGPFSEHPEPKIFNGKDKLESQLSYFFINQSHFAHKSSTNILSFQIKIDEQNLNYKIPFSDIVLPGALLKKILEHVIANNQNKPISEEPLPKLRFPTKRSQSTEPCPCPPIGKPPRKMSQDYSPPPQIETGIQEHAQPKKTEKTTHKQTSAASFQGFLRFFICGKKETVNVSKHMKQQPHPHF